MKNISKNINHVLSKAGFTLVELLVVMAILGILIAVAIAGIGIAQRGARDNTRIRDLTSIKAALEDFYGATKTYPASSEFKITSGSPATFSIVRGSNTYETININQSGANAGVTNLATATPDTNTCSGTTTKPDNNNWWICFGTTSGGYYLGATLENGTVYNLSSQ